MALSRIMLAVFLIVFGGNILLGLSLPLWIIGVLALVAGVLLLVENFRIRVDPK
jgi:hypothetical protein